MRLKKLMSLVIIGLVLTSCSNKQNVEYNEVEHNDMFTRLSKDVNDDDNVGELNTEEIKNKFEEYGDMSWYTEGIEEETNNSIENWNEEYNNKYESNINVNEDMIYTDISEYTWYNPVINSEFEYNIHIHQWLAYGIHEYYNHEVTENFSCELPVDIVDSETNMIFTVRVHGDDLDLDILLDMYNYKIIINEVQ